MPKKYLRNVTQTQRVFGIFASFCLFGLVLSLSTFIPVYADTSSVATTNGTGTASTDITVNLVDTLSIRTLDSSASSEISTLNLELTPTPSGKFVKNTSIVDVSTSNSTGYKLYMTSNYVDNRNSTTGGNSGSSGSSVSSGSASDPVYTTDMLHLDTNVDYTIPTITPSSGDTITESQFSVANSSYRNNWGYSINAKSITNPYGTDSSSAVISDVSDASAITYKSIPSHSTSDLINDSVTSAVDYSYTPVTIGINVDTNIASGTYRNELEFTAIGNALPVTYSLSFNANTDGAGGEDMSVISNLYSAMTSSVVASSYTFTLPDPEDNNDALMRKDYMFSGWNTKTDGTGDTYKAGEEYTIAVDTSLAPSEQSSRTLYATWKPLPDFWKITYMQDMTSSICNSVYTPTNATELTEPKAVMIDKTAAMAGKYTATSDNTSPNVAQGTFYDYRGLDGTGDKDNKVSPESSNAISYTVRKLADGNCWMSENLFLPLSTTQAVEISSNDGVAVSTKWTPDSCTIAQPCAINSMTSYDSLSEEWYYTWYAATAGSGVSTQKYYDAAFSICPAGWRLPAQSSYNASKSYETLFIDYFGATQIPGDVYQTIEHPPFSFYRYGYYAYWPDTGTAVLYNYVYGEFFINPPAGNFWTSSAGDIVDIGWNQHYSYGFAYDENAAWTDISHKSDLGFNVRCVAI